MSGPHRTQTLRPMVGETAAVSPPGEADVPNPEERDHTDVHQEPHGGPLVELRHGSDVKRHANRCQSLPADNVLGDGEHLALWQTNEQGREGQDDGNAGADGADCGGAGGVFPGSSETRPGPTMKGMVHRRAPEGSGDDGSPSASGIPT